MGITIRLREPIGLGDPLFIPVNLAARKTGLGIDIYDIQYKGLFNRNGVYKVDLLIDSLLILKNVGLFFRSLPISQLIGLKAMF